MIALLAIAFAAHAVPAPAGSSAPDHLRLSQLIGAPVMDGARSAAGIASDVVVDMHERRIAFALVAAGPGAPVFSCVVAPGGLSIQGSGFVLPQEAGTIEAVPSCSEAGWPREPTARLPRHILGSELLRADLEGPDGSGVGSLRDVAVQADGGLAHAVGQLRDGAGLVNLAIRPVARSGGRLSMPTLPSDRVPQPLATAADKR